MAYPKYGILQPQQLTEGLPSVPLSSFANLAAYVELDATAVFNFILANGFFGRENYYLTPVPLSSPNYVGWDIVIAAGGTPAPFAACITAGHFSYSGSTSNMAKIYLDTTIGAMDDYNTTIGQMAVPIGTCFKFAIATDIYDPISELLVARYNHGCTNAFQRVAATDESSVIRYSNASDAFDFNYEGYGGLPTDAFYNVMELPLWLISPILEEQSKMYKRSDGTNQILSSRSDQAWHLETDMMPAQWHQALQVALAHDTLLIDSPTVAEYDPITLPRQFVKKDAYEIAYNSRPHDIRGKGKTKLLAANPIHLINTNCQ